jgi:hypothetical protein
MKNTSRNEREIRLQLPNAAAHPHGEENTSLTTILTCLNACESIQHMKSLSVHRIRIQNRQQVRENCSKQSMKETTKIQKKHKIWTGMTAQKLKNTREGGNKKGQTAQKH